jgi:hypothetical protein
MVYSWLNPGLNYGYSNTFDTSMVVVSLGLKILFGDSTVKGYIGLGGDIAPVSTTFNKLPTDGSGNLYDPSVPDLSSGSYSAMAVGGYAKFGLDFALSKTMSLGPFLGLQVLSATNFQNGSNVLSVNTTNGDVGVPALSSNFPTTGTNPLTMDYSNINFGLDLKFSF